MQALALDSRFAVRQFIKSPGFTTLFPAKNLR
jgi:hypothetical protein